MQPWLLAVLIPLELAVALTVVGFILKAAWQPLQQGYAQQQVLTPHFRRSFQSLSFGLINAGFCYHITVDDEHLHLTPVLPLRWLGQRMVSIPWNAIRFHQRQPMSKRFSRVLIGKQEIVAPAWCFEMLKLQEPL